MTVRNTNPNTQVVEKVRREIEPIDANAAKDQERGDPIPLGPAATGQLE